MKKENQCRSLVFSLLYFAEQQQSHFLSTLYVRMYKLISKFFAFIVEKHLLLQFSGFTKIIYAFNLINFADIPNNLYSITGYTNFFTISSTTHNNEQNLI